MAAIRCSCLGRACHRVPSQMSHAFGLHPLKGQFDGGTFFEKRRGRLILLFLDGAAIAARLKQVFVICGEPHLVF